MYFYGTLATRTAANEGYPVGSLVDQTTGITKFDDTWRKVEAVAMALSKGVTVSIMVSAPCAIGAHPEGEAASPEHNTSLVLYSTNSCPLTLFLDLSGYYGPESAYGGPTACNGVCV